MGSNSNIQQQLGNREERTFLLTFEGNAGDCLVVNLYFEDGQGHQAGGGVHMTGLLRGKN